MKKYWIFVVRDGEKHSANEIFSNLLNEKMWGLGAKTLNRERIDPGDEIVFYRTGEAVLIGTATLDSRAISIEELKQSPKLTALEKEEKLRMLGEYYPVEYVLFLKNTKIWQNPISIKGLIDNLEFMKKKQIWGVYLQGGVRAISKPDFEKMIQTK